MSPGLALRRFVRLWREGGIRPALRRALGAVLFTLTSPALERRLEQHRDQMRSELGAEIERTRSELGVLTEIVGAANPAVSGAKHDTSSEPLITVVMAVRNRPVLARRAAESVLAQSFGRWELRIVDDGSDADPTPLLAHALGDTRVSLERCGRIGAGAARNVGLVRAHGAIVGYLDSDCVMYPGALEAAAAAFAGAPACLSIYLAQQVFDTAAERTRVYGDRFDRAALLGMRMRLDLNAFFHRIELYRELGGFDATLTRLIDWDLILRYTAEREPEYVPALVGRYETGHGGISETRPLEPNLSRVLSRFTPDGLRPLRVLYLAERFPQSREPSITGEIAEMRRRCVEVAVWSPQQPTRTDDLRPRVFRGRLRDAVRTFDPDLLHGQWRPSDAVATASEFELPLTSGGSDPEALHRQWIELAPHRSL